MSLLAPLYFFGALAIGAPILLHLIRRQPKGQVEFSSLMFLDPTPPRLTRRSRLDNWFLLLLRALALLLLAAAFARPFLRSVALSESEVPGRRLVMVVDTSASMQRTGLWQQAMQKADEVLEDLQPADQLAIVAFDRRPRTVLGFEQAGKLNTEQLTTAAKGALRELTPTWKESQLGLAISYAGELAVASEPESETEENANASGDMQAGEGAGPAHLILISDMASGSEIESLQVYAWPKQLQLDVRRVTTPQRTNAVAQVLEAAKESADDVDRVRVRVANSDDATESRFRIRWAEPSSSDGFGAAATGAASAAGSNTAGMELPVQVPPGESRVIRMPVPEPGMTSLVLQGDDHSYDNTRYVVSPQPQNYELHHLGRVLSEPRESLLFYLQRIPFDNSRRTVSVRSFDPRELQSAPLSQTVPLVVVSETLSAEAAARVKAYVESGGRALFVFGDERDAEGMAKSIDEISGSALAVSEPKVNDYAMLSKIDFAHPLFRPMSDPQFNDFSKIRFWSHRRLQNVGDEWDVVAKFDDGDPALLARPIGKGELFVLTSGWQPSQSQLALSTKFIPFVFSLFDARAGIEGSESYVVGDPIDFPPSATATILGPTGTSFSYQAVEDLEAMDQPGVYTYRDGDKTCTFAVNLAESESRTAPMDDEEFERFGVVLGKNLKTEQTLENQRQLRDQELEGRQRMWQWLLLAVLVFLGTETLLGAIWSRRRPSDAVALETG
jgi:hypothetical protein